MVNPLPQHALCGSWLTSMCTRGWSAGDHIYGLPGLICSLAGFGLDLAEVPIYGPPGLRRFVDVALQAQTMATRSNSRFRIIELTTALREQERVRMQNKHVDIPGGTLLPEEGETPMRWRVHETSQATVYAARLEHSVACFGYVVEEKSKPGTINEKLCISRGLLPGPSYRTLKEGGSVELPDGSVIHAQEVCSPPIPGRKVVVLGDTCGLGDMQSLAQDADVCSAVGMAHVPAVLLLWMATDTVSCSCSCTSVPWLRTTASAQCRSSTPPRRWRAHSHGSSQAAGWRSG